MGVARPKLALLLLAAGLTASWSSTEAPGQATAGGRYRIDFRVLNGDGAPVRDLRQHEVSITIGGRPRAITPLHLVESSRGQTVPGVPRPFATSADARTAADIHVVVDERGLTARAAAQLLEAVDALTETLGPADRMGILSLRPSGASLAPSTAREAARGAVAAMTSAPEACASVSNLGALTSLIRARIDDAPAAFVVFTGDETRCGIDADGLARLETASRGAPVQLYFVQLGEGALPPRAESIAATTGGRVIQPDEQPRAAMAHVARETSAYYLAGVDLEPFDRDGSTQPLEVRVTRRDARVMARSSIAMPTGGRPVQALLARDMARRLFPYREFGLRAAAYVSRNDDGQIKLVVLYEPDDDTARLAGASLALFDASGALVRQSTATAEDLAGRPAVGALVASPGRYVLRVAATDAARRGAAVDLDVDAQLTPAGDITLSALAFGGPDVLTFEPRLLFRDEPAAVAYLEMYGVPTGSTLQVRFELAATPEGPALRTMPAMLPPSPAPGRIATAAIPIAQLAPGDYVVRAHVSVDGELVGQTSGAIRKR